MTVAAAPTAVTNPFSVLQGGTGATAKADESTASADRFLTMLVTQLKNQDPLNPMDNAQITSQMAQINAVTGLDKVNASVKALNTQLLGMQALQGASLVGREVLVEGDRLAVADGKGRGVVELADSATAVTVGIFDSGLQLVGKFELGPLKAGRTDVEFDMGKLPADRAYSFVVSATSGKTAVAARSLMLERVQSVANAGDTLTLSLAGGGELALGQVVAFK